MTAVYRPAHSLSKRLAKHMNAGTLWNLPKFTSAPRDPQERFSALAAMGVEALQHPSPEVLPRLTMPIVGMGRIDNIHSADHLARKHKANGYVLTTVHVGTGFESDGEIDDLIGSVIAASREHKYPIFVETHRATVTQDIYRTLLIVERHPAIRFNGDLSHYYTGHEMTYGDISAKFDAMEPIFQRVRYIHGRIGTPCCMQVALTGSDDTRAFVEHFRDMWSRVMQGFSNTAEGGEVLPFAPELLPYELPMGDEILTLHYAQKQTVKGKAVEESDRWQQAQFLFDIAEECASKAGLKLG